VLLLARQILERIGVEMGRGRLRLSNEAEKVLVAHSWPGNVRELRNVLEHAALFSRHDTLQPDDFRESLAAPMSVASAAPGSAPATPSPASTAGMTLQDAERAHIEATLRSHDWAVPRVAEVLGLSRTALYDRIRKHGIQLPRR
jgi:DNA-binding NtrC family response regulator